MQNRPLSPGRYVFWLADGLDIHDLPVGDYQLEVLASDTRDNTGSNAVTFTIDQSAGATRGRRR
jgi:hypothetical protein